jgi:hypothetical protein
MVGRRRDRWLIRVPPQRALEIAADPSRFPEFNPLVRVPQTSGRVEEVGNVYHQVFALGPIRVATRWETLRVDPPNLSDRPRPTPPWTTVELGQLSIFGQWHSTTRYDAVKGGTVITHDLEYPMPDGLAGRILDLVLMRPLLALGFRLLGRRVRAWIENAAD